MRRSPSPSSPSSPSWHALPPVRTGSDRLARVYDEQIHPLLGQRFADMLLAAVGDGPRTSVLEIGCASGAMTTELAHRLGRECRIIALDGVPALIELARARVVTEEHAGRHVFFRTHAPSARLPLADGSFDLVLASVALADLPDPAAAIADWARVVRRGGEMLLGTPLRGTWSEPIDLLREVLIRAQRPEALAALDAYVASQPEPDAVARHLEGAGLGGVDVDLRRWELVFRSAREFFYAPVIEHGPLQRWKDIVGRGPAMHDVFLAMKEAIDTYYAGHPFSVSVFGGRFSARKG